MQLFQGWTINKAQADLAALWGYITGALGLPPGRATASLPAYLANNATYNVKDFGATGDGVADDTLFIQQALDAAIAAGGGRVTIPAGRYKTTANLNVSVSAASAISLAIEAERYGIATLLPQAGVSRALDVSISGGTAGQDNRIHIAGLHIDGVGTTNAKGLSLGRLPFDTYPTAHTTLEGVEIYRFAGATGVALDIAQVVGLFARNCRFARSNVNINVDSTDGAMPTWLVFDTCWVYLAVAKGIVVKQGYRITFSDCAIESNGQEGVYSVPTGNVFDLSLIRCWFESNGGVANVYGDGTTGGTNSIKVRSCYFSGVTPAVYLKHCGNVLVDDISLLTGCPDNTVTLEDCSGDVTNWPVGNADITTKLRILGITSRVPISAAATDRIQWNITDPARPIFGAMFGSVGNDQGIVLGRPAVRYGRIYGTAYIDWLTTPDWSASVTPDGSAGHCRITATSNIGWALQVPSSGEWGSRITITIRNASGVAMGGTTFAGGYRQTGYVNPPTGSETSAEFHFDLTAWRQKTPWVTTVSGATELLDPASVEFFAMFPFLKRV